MKINQKVSLLNIHLMFLTTVENFILLKLNPALAKGYKYVAAFF